MRVLRIDRPDGRRVRKFDGPSGRGLWYRPLGDEYKVSVTRLTFYVIWHDRHSADWLAALASPYPASPDFPLFRGQNKTPRNTLFINGSTVSTGYSATVEVLHRTSTVGRSKAPRLPIKALSFCRPTELRRWQRNWIHRGVPRPANPVTCFPTGKGVVPTTKGGMHFLERSEAGLFSSGEARLSGFRRQRRPKNWRPPRAPTSPAQRYFITSEGGALNLPVRRQPFTGRTLAAQGRQARRLPQPSPAGRQPSGIQVNAESLTKAHDLKCRTQQKSTNHHS